MPNLHSRRTPAAFIQAGKQADKRDLDVDLDGCKNQQAGRQAGRRATCDICVRERKRILCREFVNKYVYVSPGVCCVWGRGGEWGEREKVTSDVLDDCKGRK